MTRLLSWFRSPFRSVSERLRLAIGLVLVDRFPELAGRDELWVGVDDEGPRPASPWAEPICVAFAARWQEREIPSDIDRIRAVLDRIVTSGFARFLLRTRLKVAAFQAARRDPLLAVNVGPGRRSANLLAVAAAVDACLDGAPSVALPANTSGVDPTVFADVDALFDREPPLSVATAAEVRLAVDAWGPGAKGIVTVREPGLAILRVFNARNEDGVARFYDYSKATRVTWNGRLVADRSPSEAAEEILAKIDPKAAFASVRLWRTADLDGAMGVDENFHQLDRQQRRAVLDRVLASSVPGGDREQVLDRVMARADLFADVDYTRWLARQVQIGAATMLPHELEALLAKEELAPPITAVDEALAAFVFGGLVNRRGDRLEITVADTPANRQRFSLFPDALLREGPIDGMADGCIEVQLSHRSRQRLLAAERSFEAPAELLPWPVAAGEGGSVEASLIEPRGLSWIDTNQALSPGSRKHNCWNVAAAVANYLSTGAPSIGLPRYDGADLGLNIAEFFRLIGASGTEFVESLSDGQAVARSWGCGQHGVVAASLNSMSTHMFNVVFDGEEVRFLDGYGGLPGEFQFEKTWERIGIAHIGPIAPTFVARSTVLADA